jgi:hypothetical protein
MGAVLFAIAVAALPVHAQVVSPCGKLAGEEQKRCLEQERKPKKCDALFGPEKEACLKRGGTVRAKAWARASQSPRRR